MGALGGELSAALKTAITKSSKKAVSYSDETAKIQKEIDEIIKKNTDEVEEALQKKAALEKLDELAERKLKFNSIADPVADILGSALKSHPKRVEQITSYIKSKGGKIEFRNKEALGYSPGIRAGEPGKLIVHPDASISAWEHEFRHFLDDELDGFLGMSALFDADTRVWREVNAYLKEIEFVKSLGGEYTEVITQLKKNFIDEMNYINENINKIEDQELLLTIEKYFLK